MKFYWKMRFHPYPDKQATEVCFSRRALDTTNQQIFLNNTEVIKCPYHKHLVLHLDEKLYFGFHQKGNVMNVMNVS